MANDGRASSVRLAVEYSREPATLSTVMLQVEYSAELAELSAASLQVEYADVPTPGGVSALALAVEYIRQEAQLAELVLMVEYGEPLPVTPVPVPDVDCTCGPGTWLLDLEVGGRVFRYSTRTLEVADADGATYVYLAGLTDFEMPLDGTEESQAIEIVDHRVAWSLLAATGVDFARARATLRHILDDQVLEQAITVLDGRLDEPERANPDRPASLVGTIQLDEDDRAWPDPRAVVTTETWEFGDLDLGEGQYDEQLRGAVYPFVFGYPGDDGSGGNPLGTTPALMAELKIAPPNHPQARWVVAQGIVDATTARLFAPDQTNGSDGFVGAGDFPISTMTDLLGRTVSVIFVDDTDPEIWPTPGQEYYVGWRRSAGLGGGNLRPDRQGPIRTLTEVALWVLANSGRQVDLQAQQAEAQHLDAFLIDGCLNDNIDGLVPWFERTLVPLVPIVRARTSRGMYWRFVNYGASTTDAVARLDVDEGSARQIGAIRTPFESVRNRFTLHGGYTPRSDQYTVRRSIADRPGAALPWFEHQDHVADDRVIGSPVCARSVSAYDVRDAGIIQTKFIWDPGTLTRSLQHMATRDAFPRQRVPYTVDHREWRHRRAGDIVQLTDSANGFRDEVAVIEWLRLSSFRTLVVGLQVMDRRVRA